MTAPRPSLLGRFRKSQPIAGPDEETVVLEDLARADFARRRRAERWRRFRFWLLALILVLLIGLVIWLLYLSSFLVVRNVRVTGNGLISEQRILRTAAVPKGVPLARIDLKAIRERVEELPPIESAEVSRDWPDQIRIAITPRTPVAVMETGAGFAAFDDEGALFGNYADRPPGLPLVQASPRIKKTALAESARVLGELPTELAQKLDFIRVASVDQITLVLLNGRTVQWGSSAQSEQKAEVLEALLKQPGNHLDVSVPSQPTIR